MIKVKSLIKRFVIRPVLNGLDFEVSSGEFVGLLGPNGAGKTTFLRILSSLSRPTLGSVKMAGYFLPQQATMVRSKLGLGRDYCRPIRHKKNRREWAKTSISVAKSLRRVWADISKAMPP